MNKSQIFHNNHQRHLSDSFSPQFARQGKCTGKCTGSNFEPKFKSKYQFETQYDIYSKFTILHLSCLIWKTVLRTFNVSAPDSISCNKVSRAIRVPVRPTPAEQWVTMGAGRLKFLFSNISDLKTLFLKFSILRWRIRFDFTLNFLNLLQKWWSKRYFRD